MDLQQLPPEIIYSILQFLPSTDVTTMASFHCRTIREWSLVLMNERAQESMLQGWRLMIGATTIKPGTSNNKARREKDREYIYEFDYIDSRTLDMYFCVGTLEEDETSLVNCTTPSTSLSTTSPPPEQHQQKPDQPCIPMDFGHTTTTTIHFGLLKFKVPTTRLEYATSLPDHYNFDVTADYYVCLVPKYSITLSADRHSGFTTNYSVHRLSPIDDDPHHQTTLSQQEPNPDTSSNAPPSPPPSTTTTKPDIVLRIDSLKIAPKWWWSRIDRRLSTFLGTEHQYW